MELESSYNPQDSSQFNLTSQNQSKPTNSNPSDTKITQDLFEKNVPDMQGNTRELTSKFTTSNLGQKVKDLETNFQTQFQENPDEAMKDKFLKTAEILSEIAKNRSVLVQREHLMEQTSNNFDHPNQEMEQNLQKLESLNPAFNIATKNLNTLTKNDENQINKNLTESLKHFINNGKLMIAKDLLIKVNGDNASKIIESVIKNTNAKNLYPFLIMLIDDQLIEQQKGIPSQVHQNQENVFIDKCYAYLKSSKVINRFEKESLNEKMEQLTSLIELTNIKTLYKFSNKTLPDNVSKEVISIVINNPIIKFILDKLQNLSNPQIFSMLKNSLDENKKSKFISLMDFFFKDLGKNINEIKDEKGNTLLHYLFIQREYGILNQCIQKYNVKTDIPNEAGQICFQTPFKDLSRPYGLNPNRMLPNDVKKMSTPEAQKAEIQKVHSILGAEDKKVSANRTEHFITQVLPDGEGDYVHFEYMVKARYQQNPNIKGTVLFREDKLPNFAKRIENLRQQCPGLDLQVIPYQGKETFEKNDMLNRLNTNDSVLFVSKDVDMARDYCNQKGIPCAGCFEFGWWPDILTMKGTNFSMGVGDKYIGIPIFPPPVTKDLDQLQSSELKSICAGNPDLDICYAYLHSNEHRINYALLAASASQKDQVLMKMNFKSIEEISYPDFQNRLFDYANNAGVDIAQIKFIRAKGGQVEKFDFTNPGGNSTGKTLIFYEGFVPDQDEAILMSNSLFTAGAGDTSYSKGISWAPLSLTAPVQNTMQFVEDLNLYYDQNISNQDGYTQIQTYLENSENITDVDLKLKLIQEAAQLIKTNQAQLRANAENLRTLVSKKNIADNIQKFMP